MEENRKKGKNLGEGEDFLKVNLPKMLVMLNNVFTLPRNYRAIGPYRWNKKESCFKRIFDDFSNIFFLETLPVTTFLKSLAILASWLDFNIFYPPDSIIRYNGEEKKNSIQIYEFCLGAILYRFLGK